MSGSVSESIGKLLLEGYKMLADSCEVCCTVLMQDRRGRVICVKCESALRANAGQGDASVTTSGKMCNGGNSIKLEEKDTGNVSSNSAIASTLDEACSSSSAMSGTEEILASEIKNAALNLRRISQEGRDTQEKLMLIKYIRECAETLKSLKEIRKA